MNFQQIESWVLRHVVLQAAPSDQPRCVAQRRAPILSQSAVRAAIRADHRIYHESAVNVHRDGIAAWKDRTEPAGHQSRQREQTV